MYFDERRTHFLQDRLQRRLKECHARFLLQLLPPADQPRRQGRTGAAAGKSYGQRNQFLPQQGATRSVPQAHAGRSASPQAGAAGLLAAHLERGLLDRAGTLHPGHAGGRRAGLLLPAQSAAVDMPSPKPLIPPPWKVEILASDISYSVLRAGQEGTYTETPDGERWTTATACATSTRPATATRSRRR